MNIRAQKLIGLPVKTKSSIALGKVYDFDVDVENGMIEKYHVSDSLLVKNLLHKELIIDKSQVIEITETAMIVEDTVQKLKSSEFAQA
ncbi:MAG: PRC-barrel domain-containing protein [Candidatus Buchananbacteria bacterium]